MPQGQRPSLSRTTLRTGIPTPVSTAPITAYNPALGIGPPPELSISSFQNIGGGPTSSPVTAPTPQAAPPLQPIIPGQEQQLPGPVPPELPVESLLGQVPPPSATRPEPIIGETSRLSDPRPGQPDLGEVLNFMENTGLTQQGLAIYRALTGTSPAPEAGAAIGAPPLQPAVPGAVVGPEVQPVADQEPGLQQFAAPPEEGVLSAAGNLAGLQPGQKGLAPPIVPVAVDQYSALPPQSPPSVTPDEILPQKAPPETSAVPVGGILGARGQGQGFNPLSPPDYSAAERLLAEAAPGDPPQRSTFERFAGVLGGAAAGAKGGQTVGELLLGAGGGAAATGGRERELERNEQQRFQQLNSQHLLARANMEAKIASAQFDTNLSNRKLAADAAQAEVKNTLDMVKLYKPTVQATKDGYVITQFDGKKWVQNAVTQKSALNDLDVELKRSRIAKNKAQLKKTEGDIISTPERFRHGGKNLDVAQFTYDPVTDDYRVNPLWSALTMMRDDAQLRTRVTPQAKLALLQRISFSMSPELAQLPFNAQLTAEERQELDESWALYAARKPKEAEELLADSQLAVVYKISALFREQAAKSQEPEQGAPGGPQSTAVPSAVNPAAARIGTGTESPFGGVFGSFRSGPKPGI